MKFEVKALRDLIKEYQQDQRTLVKSLTLIKKINNASVKVIFEGAFSKQLMYLGKKIKEMEDYIKVVNETTHNKHKDREEGK